MAAESIDAPLLQSTGGQIGHLVGGFIITIAISYVLLRIAGSPKRSRGVAIALRLAAILISGFLVYASYLGAAGEINAGGAIALAVVVIWAVIQQRRPSPEHPKVA